MAIGSTRGNHARRACFAASRAVVRQRASDFSARSPRQTATDRDAAHGTMVATPTSVRTSTASSPRSPLGSAWTTVTHGSGSGAVATYLDLDAEPSLAGLRHHTGDRRTGAVGEHEGLADAEAAYGDRVMRLVALDLHQVPGPTPASDSTQWTGSDIGRCLSDR